MKSLLRRIAANLPDGIQQELHRWLCVARLRTGRFVHTEPEYAALDRWVRPGDCVIDVGANLGVYTAKLSELVGANGHVFAIEPVSPTFALLAANARLFKHNNVTLLNVAASDKSGFVELAIPRFDTGIRAYTRASINEYDKSSANLIHYSASCVALDSLEIPRPVSLAKIDVEGHELPVVRGMASLLQRDRPVLIAEGTSREALQEYLATFDYEQTIMDSSSNSVYVPRGHEDRR